MRGEENEELDSGDQLNFLNTLLYRVAQYLEKFDVKFELAMLCKTL